MSCKVSVVVPVFNREKLVTRCLDSVCHQSQKPMELIVVDNGSMDNSVAVIKKWMEENKDSGIEFHLLTQLEKGACRARQTGLEKASGEYVIFFDSDDEMLPTLIEKAHLEFQKNTDIDIVCWKCRINQLDGGKRIPPFDARNALENHLIHTLLRPQGYMVRREFLVKAGGWRKNVEVWNDLELGLRILLNDPVIIGVPEVLAEIFSQEDSITGVSFSSKKGKWEKTLQEMEKETLLSSHPLKKRIIKILNYRKAILAAHYYKEGDKKSGEQLKELILEGKGIAEKSLLIFAYDFTKRGWRGAWRILSPFYKCFN